MSDEARPLGPVELDTLEALIDGWFDRTLAENPVLAAVERDHDGGSTDRRWLARLVGEEKDASTIRLSLRQRMLHHETYVMPAPEENHAAFHEHLLRRNRGLVGVSFCVGEEDAVFLVGAIPPGHGGPPGAGPAAGHSVEGPIEQCFRPALRIGFASRFGG
ncbi:MAG: hypothetical protein Ct9H300mP31_01450 [Acidimicrobiaceae bacterium]|nr:MAG: hypothetical protein Ct9H300mP31_01450 [Acidimicrobiaceae bacterium]